MADGGAPTYASLTPANPAIINGFAGVDLQAAQQLTTQQTIMNDADQALVNSMGMVNTVGVGTMASNMQTVQTMATAPTMTSVIPSPVPQQQPTPEPTPTPEAPPEPTPVERNTLIAVLQFLKKNNMKVRV